MMKNSCIQLKVSCLLQSSGIHLDLNILRFGNERLPKKSLNDQSIIYQSILFLHIIV